MSGHPDLLQTYIWQDHDVAPQYPVLKKFLDFWSHELEGPLHSVRLASQKLITATELRAAKAFALN